MLDRESELFHSGLFNKGVNKEHFAVVVSRGGLEISAMTKGCRFDYSNTWEDIRLAWDEWKRVGQNKPSRKLLEGE